MMRRSIRAPRPALPFWPPSEARLRALLQAVGEAVLPAGRLLDGFGPPSVSRVIDYIRGEGLELALAGFLLAVDAAARLRFGRGVVALDPAARRTVLRAMERASYPTRLMVKLGLVPIKALHLEDPEVFRRIGACFGPDPAPRDPDPVRARQTFSGDSLDGVTDMDCDVVVVGTGAGGAVVAAELARRGRSVIMLEAGRYFDRHDFTHMKRSSFSLAAYRPFAETLAIGGCVIPLFAGRAVGGTTTINSGTCYRTPDAVLDHWSRVLGLGTLTPEAMAPRFERVEEILGVGPTPPEHLGGSARIIARGAERLGYAHRPLDRNAPGCDGQGFCCFGCPTDAKRSTNISYVPIALRAGALLVTGAEVDQVLSRHGEAYGVSANVRRAKGPSTRLTVRARRVVLACGTLYTPMLLLGNRMGSGSGHLGRHLSIHPATACYALMDEVVDGQRGVPQGYTIEEFKHEGILFEGAFAPPELMATDLNAMGPELIEIIEAYPRIAAFGFMIKDTSRGRVRRGPGGKPLITYRLGRADVATIKRATGILIDVFRAAGARAVLPTVHGHSTIRSDADVRRFREARLGPRDFDLTAYHPLGTARMAADAKDGVVDADHEVFGTARLHVVDGSVIPSSLGVNPQITIMALATRAAERIDDLLDRKTARGT